jgi:two-component system CheB/CheR fusion protein
VDDLLDVSRIHSGKIELRKEVVFLKDVVEQAIAAVRPGLQERRHHLEVALPSDATRLRADVVRLTQVLANLLTNAIRYTEEGGRIELACTVDGEWLEARIIDNGRGIPADLLPQIFGMFVQERAGGGGLGLGLTLVERLVHLHGGTVTAASDGPGKGATFVVRVPLGLAADDRQEAASNGKAPNGASSGVYGAAQPLSVVLVEDNPDVRETMSELLTVWGHNVQTASDGPSGVDLILRVKPDLALVDLGLPGFDGYTVASEVRKQHGRNDLRLVAMSGFGQEADRRKSREVGFNAHLVKPADTKALLDVLTLSSER